MMMRYDVEMSCDMIVRMCEYDTMTLYGSTYRKQRYTRCIHQSLRALNASYL